MATRKRPPLTPEQVRSRPLVTAAGIAALTGRSKSGVKCLIAEPTFPAPVRLTQTTRRTWRTSDVIEWFATLDTVTNR